MANPATTTPRLLLMTSTIEPPAGAIYSDRNDPEVRMNDYAQALTFYLGDSASMIDRIVFIDNSAHDLSRLRAIAADPKINARAKQVEFLSFYGLDYPVQYNKGYGELRLIDHGFQHSALIRALRPDEVWWKVTGRLKALNIDRLIRTAPQRYDVYADFRHHKKASEVRLISFSRSGYETQVMGRSDDMIGDILEGWIYKRFLPMVGTGSPARVVPEFRHVPMIDGIGGFMNMRYMQGKYRAIYNARVAVRTVKNLWWPWDR